MSDGTSGWDDYAPYYDWENAQTLGRKDVAFWRGVAERTLDSNPTPEKTDKRINEAVEKILKGFPPS